MLAHVVLCVARMRLSLLGFSASLAACGGTELDDQLDEAPELEHDAQAVSVTREYLVAPQISVALPRGGDCPATFTIQLKSHNGVSRTHQVLPNRSLLANIITTSAYGVGLDSYKITIATAQPCRVAIGTQQIVARDWISAANQTRIKFAPNPNAPQSSSTARPTGCTPTWNIPIMNPDSATGGSDTWSTVVGDVRLRLRDFHATVLGTNPAVEGCGYYAGGAATMWLGTTAPAAAGTGFQAVIEVSGLNIAE